ncbi:MAG TPA: sortase [Candidatus Onthousia excrementipullorum]|uniref:Sortase n=1 Tax=Candidatus Onthousia excrementipullorum TaxID=2840884 RepID=A0A9D1J355_9FIRM|nr:sortase [Candidatus Onthousia excrementipullorum]
MLRKSLVSILLLTVYLGSCLLIYNSEKDIKSISTANLERNTNTSYISTVNKDVNDEIIGTLTIDKLNLSKNIYNINSSHNNVEENVTILNDDINLIVLAAHSGPGYIAFFNDLDKLELNDTVNLTYNNKNLVYKVINIEEQPKDGTIEINKTDKQRLILTTCSKKDKTKQLVVITKKIDA